MKLNPNKTIVKDILKKLKDNDGYCPCALIKNNDTKCNCKDMRENNICHCGLFVEEDN